MPVRVAVYIHQLLQATRLVVMVIRSVSSTVYQKKISALLRCGRFLECAWAACMRNRAAFSSS